VTGQDPIREVLRAALADASDGASVLDRLCVGIATILPVEGAAISIIADGASQGTSGASDQVAGRLDELQFTLGEGPCWDANRLGRPVLVADLASAVGHRWPMFTAAVLAAGMRSVFAFPLHIGAIWLGVLDLFGRTPGPLDREARADALVVADVAALVLIDAGHTQPAGAVSPGWDVSPLSRVEIHQATGMVMAQLEIPPHDALVRIRAYAFAHEQTTDEVAREITSRRLRLDRDESR
jgi:hypothetical protein